jgi:hypothetical protein
MSMCILVGGAELAARLPAAAQGDSVTNALVGQKARGKAQDGAKPADLAKILAIEIDTKDFQAAMSFKEFRGLLVEKLAGLGKPVQIFVNTQAFKEDDPTLPSVYDCQILFREEPKKMSVHSALRTALSMFAVGELTQIQRGGVTEVIAKGEPTFIIRDGRIEITTRRAAYKLADGKKPGG